MIDWINSNMGTAWFVFGGVLLVIEAFIFGMSTAVLLFAGFGAVITGLLIWVGLVPLTWTASFAVFTVSTVVITALLWIPFKKLQSEPTGTTRYSGIDWKVVLDKAAGGREIAAGEKVKVASVSAGLFRVTPV